MPKTPELKPINVKEIEIIKIEIITPESRNAVLKILYSFKIVTLIKKIIKIGISQDASPRITNNIALRFAPYEPKIFDGGSSFTVKKEGSNSSYEYRETIADRPNNK